VNLESHPVDVLKDLAEQAGFEVDVASFEKAKKMMEEVTCRGCNNYGPVAGWCYLFEWAVCEPDKERTCEGFEEGGREEGD
jgi:hypothetical protein